MAVIPMSLAFVILLLAQLGGAQVLMGEEKNMLHSLHQCRIEPTGAPCLVISAKLTTTTPFGLTMLPLLMIYSQL